MPGVLLPDATTRFGRKLKSRGELIFTHSGVSGPAVLDLSGSVARELADRGRAVLECSWESREAEEFLRHPSYGDGGMAAAVRIVSETGGK